MKNNKQIPPNFARKISEQQRPVYELSVTAASRNRWNEVLDAIRAAKDALDVRQNEDWWYRGQASTFALRPSLFRLLDRGFNDKDDDPRSIYQLEYDLYFDFAYRGPGMQEVGLSGWDKLFYMRHHGLPTRVLDWTERLGVAVFFAVSEVISADQPTPCIWILSPALLNKYVLNDRDLYSPNYLGYDWSEDEAWDYEDYLIFENGSFDWKGPVAIYPPQKNNRMRSQTGWFTMFGQDTRPLEAQFDPQEYPGLIRKVEIPHEAIPAAREFLTDAGINEASIYPDLDGFAAYLRSLYQIPR
jgi:hypothetical protein